MNEIRDPTKRASNVRHFWLSTSILFSAYVVANLIPFFSVFVTTQYIIVIIIHHRHHHTSSSSSYLYQSYRAEVRGHPNWRSLILCLLLCLMLSGCAYLGTSRDSWSGVRFADFVCLSYHVLSQRHEKYSTSIQLYSIIEKNQNETNMDMVGSQTESNMVVCLCSMCLCVYVCLCP